MKKNHKCQFKDTGKAIYTDPLRIEQKCKCGKIRWKGQKSLIDKTIIYEYDKDPDLDPVLLDLLKQVKLKMIDEKH